MKLCPDCQQRVAEDVALCPNCGASLPTARQTLDDYQLTEFVREGYGCMLYRARKAGDAQTYLIRLFKPQTRLDDTKVERLRRELAELKKLPAKRFVQHFEIKRSAEDDWYRVSEWVEAEAWSNLLASDFGGDSRRRFGLLARIAEAVDELHQHGHLIPHLILPDLLVTRASDGQFEVKLDFKLSRFLDPELSHPSPQLLALLKQHPDIAGKRPLDARTDIWSLGRVFVAILTRSSELDHPLAELDGLRLPQSIRTVLRAMLSDDPDSRPRSLALVSAALRNVSDTEFANAAQPAPAGLPGMMRTLQRRVALLGGVALLLLGAATFLQLRFGLFSRDDAQVLGRHARRLSSSVAFVAVEYRFEVGTNVICHALSTGTAFLVDREGRLLSNRHVACPWLGKPEFWKGIVLARITGLPTKFSHRMMLWFDGAQALKLARDEIQKPALDDLFAAQTGYGLEGPLRVRVVGTLPPVWDQGALREFPLGEDVAVLQVEPPPKLDSLPLASNHDGLRQLDAVALLGFPRGVQTMPGREIRASATMGHVRRAFANVLQSDVSTHPGNSGGPVLNLEGRVIGIASAVSLGSDSPLGASPQSDLSLILPIERATNLLAAVQRGAARWNGLPLPQAGLEVVAAVRLATQGQWLEARTAIDRVSSSDPDVLLTTAVLHHCARDDDGAARRLADLREMSPESVSARFLQAVWAWPRNPADADRDLKALIPSDWASGDAEFFGQLAALLLEPTPAVRGEPPGDSRVERTLFSWAQAVRLRRAGKAGQAEPALRVALREAGPEEWSTALARYELEQVQRAEAARHTDAVARQRYRDECDRFWAEIEASSARRIRMDHALLGLQLQFMLSESAADKERLLRQSRLTDSLDRGVSLQLASLHAQHGEWLEATRELGIYLQPGGREGINRDGAILLRGQILELAGQELEARATVESLARNASFQWYRDLARMLRGEVQAEALRPRAASNPMGGLTLEVALGLRAEAGKHNTEAIEHYRNALEFGLSQYLEHTLAKERLLALRAK